MDEQMDRFAPLTDEERATAILAAPPKHDNGELISPVPANAPDLPMAHHQHGKPSQRWAYRDAAGAVLFWVLRFDPPGRCKQFLPLTLWRHRARLKWRWVGVPAPRPLYRLDQLAARPNGRAIVCEGEKAADAAAKIFPDSVATCSPNGANSAAKADWSPLKGRPVVIWPDADKTGDDYASEVTRILHELRCDISIIDARVLAAECPDGGKREPSKQGWDAADAIREWPDPAALRRAAVNCAKPFVAAESAPAYVSFGKFTMDADGLHADVERGRGKNSEVEIVRVSAPFEILGRGRDPEGRAWGRFLRWRDPDGRLHEKFVADENLHGDASAVCAPLAADGLEIVREQQRAFTNYLSSARPAGRVTVVQRTGWHEIEGENVFVLPGECIGLKSLGRVLLDGAAHGPYETKGTLAEWRDGVGSLAAGHAIPTLAISTAFAGPLLHLGGFEGAALICSDHPAGERRRAFMVPRAFGGAVQRPAMFGHGAQRRTDWKARRRNPLTP